MLRASVCTLTMLALFGAGMATADDSKKANEKDKQHEKGTITKIDSKKNTVTVSMKNDDGKVMEKTAETPSLEDIAVSMVSYLARRHREKTGHETSKVVKT